MEEPGNPPPSSQPSEGSSSHNGKSRFRGRWKRFRRRDDAPVESPVETLNLAELESLSMKELQKRASEMGVTLSSDDRKAWNHAMLKAHAEKLQLGVSEGILEMIKGGFGFLRSPAAEYKEGIHDAYVSASLIRNFGLKPGDQVMGMSRPPRNRERYQTLLSVDLIWDQLPEKMKDRKAYDELTPLFPKKRLVLETRADAISARALDLFVPLGRGQRCLLVAPPRAGKTILMQQIAEGVAINDPDVDILMLLLDERPEEVYNARRIVKGEVVSSTFDESVEHHLRMADLVMEKACRMVENGRHVVLFLDSLTRLARACNAMSSGKGKLMSGGVESGALAKPRKFFTAARNIEEGGSLTIVATVLVETGSRMDDLIFEEFKGTGNMEVYLSRDLQERRIYPAIHIEKSGTRREDLLYHPDELARIQILRRQLSEHPPLEAMEKLIEQLRATGSNAELLMLLKAG